MRAVEDILMTLIERYREKENYFNKHTLEWWRGHLDTVTVDEYAKLMGDKVLDIGCNAGGLTHLMAKRFKSVVGIDVNRKAIEMAKEGFKDAHFICCLANDIPFADGFFDGVYCFQTLEHLFKEDMEPTLREISRVVRKGGHILATMPKAGDEDDAMHKERAYDPSHISFFRTEVEVMDFFRGIFRIVSIKHETRPNPGRPEEKPHNSWIILLKNSGAKHE